MTRGSRRGPPLLPAAGDGEQAARMCAALAEELPTLYRVVRYVADEGTSEDEVVEALAVLAVHATVGVRRGRERAWLLNTLLRLLGADLQGDEERDLPRLPDRSVPDRIELPGAETTRLLDTLQLMEKPERAALVLVVQQGLSMDQGARIMGVSRDSFVRLHAQGLRQLGDDLVDALMGS